MSHLASSPGEAPDARMRRHALTVLRDLDRCPHGRHLGDVCAGWRGPGEHDGGCRGGRSLGNPLIAPGQQIGYTLYGDPIVMPIELAARDDPNEWVRRSAR